MIITDNVSSPVVSNIIASPSRFKIKASAKAFKILSGFYSEPILAIPRELGANAWDSHVKAGNTKQMFEVHAPNTLEPWFSVRDFGTGLSPEAIDTIYTTYFESTKTNDNDSDGCMGLGSKTPFNYTDNFNVTSWHNGKKYVYNCFIDENGAPNIMHVATENTTEHNGVEVKFGVKIADINMWTDKIRRAYEPFRHRPSIKGATIVYPERKHIFSGKTWSMREKDPHGNHVSYAFMGNYCYPISTNVLNYVSGSDKVINMLYYGSFDLYFDIGELEVAPNKEQLQYDDANNKTANAIINALTHAKVELTAMVKKNIEIPKSLWEAMGLYAKYNGFNSSYASLRSILGDIPIQYQNKKITSSNMSNQEIYQVLDIKHHPDFSLYAFTDRGVTRTLKRSSGLYAQPDQDVIVYYTENLSIKKSRVRHHLDSVLNVSNSKTAKPVAYVIVDLSEKCKHVNDLKNYLGWSNVINIETLPKPPVLPRQKRMAASDEVLVADISSLVSYYTNTTASKRNIAAPSFSRKSAKFDGSSEYYYVDFLYNDPIWNGKNMKESMDSVINVFAHKKLNGSSMEIYGINKKNAHLMKVGKWINVFDLVKTKVFDANKSVYEHDLYMANLHGSFMEYHQINHIVVNNSNFFSKLKSEDTKKMFSDFIKGYAETADKLRSTHSSLFPAFGISAKKHKPDIFDIASFGNILQNKYMNLFSLAHGYREDINTIIDIINFIDKKS